MAFPEHDGPKVTDGRKDGHSKLVYDKESRTIVQQRDTMTADQQIRAKALECVCLLWDAAALGEARLSGQEMFCADLEWAERYIREGHDNKSQHNHRKAL